MNESEFRTIRTGGPFSSFKAKAVKGDDAGIFSFLEALPRQQVYGLDQKSIRIPV